MGNTVFLDPQKPLRLVNDSDKTWKKIKISFTFTAKEFKLAIKTSEKGIKVNSPATGRVGGVTGTPTCVTLATPTRQPLGVTHVLAKAS